MSTRKWRSDGVMKRQSAAVRAFTRAAAILFVAALPPLAGCRGDRSDNPPRQFFPDMDDQPRWKAQDRSEFFADGRTMRQPPQGAVAFGRSPVVADEPWAATYTLQRAQLLKNDARVYRGVDDNGNPLTTIPVEVTPALLDRGQSRFDIYCAACHGIKGDGKGLVGQTWSYPLPSFHDERFLPGGTSAAEGHIFDVALHGFVGPTGRQLMPGYAHALTEHDAWAIVAYIRALQRANRAGLQDVPESERTQLQGAARPAPAAEGGS
ncbi:MAG TPA: cytochrome c [Phycisphaerales bacterium]|nr:cytochrome c [Phycisphaerales bacterium]